MSIWNGHQLIINKEFKQNNIYCINSWILVKLILISQFNRYLKKKKTIRKEIINFNKNMENRELLKKYRKMHKKIKTLIYQTINAKSNLKFHPAIW
jgi:hypothetical protein